MQHIHIETIIPPELTGKRLDQALAKLFPQHSRSRLQTWIQSGKVKLDNQAVQHSKDKVVGGQKVVIDVLVAAQEQWQPQSLPIGVVYQDEDIIVVNKPPGLVVHPAYGNPANTLVNGLINQFPELAQLPRAGIVHRLDKDTSGLLVVARTLEAHTHLVTQIQARHVERDYEALVNGVMISGGSIETQMGRHPHKRTHMAVVQQGKQAITHYRVLERFRTHTRIRVTLESGRTHQIRVHMAHIHYPIVGDPTYGGRLKFAKGISAELKQALQNFKRQALHARRLGITHPHTGLKMHWEAPLPDDMQQLIELLRCQTLKVDKKIP